MSKSMLMCGVSTYTFLQNRSRKINPRSTSSRPVFSPLLPFPRGTKGCVVKASLEDNSNTQRVPTLVALLVSLIPIGYTYTYVYAPPSLAALEIDQGRGASLFRNACIGCHDAGGNIIQPGATLFANDLERNGASSEDEIYNITYYGKGRMPGFGEKCMPRGSCTFGPRLQDEDIRVLAQFVKSQAEQGWRTLP